MPYVVTSNEIVLLEITIVSTAQPEHDTGTQKKGEKTHIAISANRRRYRFAK